MNPESKLNICDHCKQWISVDNSGLTATDIAKLKIARLEARLSEAEEKLQNQIHESNRESFVDGWEQAGSILKERAEQ